jgi:Tol biopolymer transport system component
MAPEQIEGGEVDARTDIFALGLVVYEMLTGKRAFEGETQASVIGAILKDTPAPIATLQPSVPAALDHVVSTCLSKDPEDRWQSTRDVLRSLTWIRNAGISAVVSTAASSATRTASGVRAALAAAAIVAIAAIGLAIFAPRRGPVAESPAVQFVVAPPQTFTFIAGGGQSVPTVSPDGRHLAAVVAQAGITRIWVRSVDSLEGRVLPGTDGTFTPYWSSDGRALAFVAGQVLKTIDASGGPVRTVGDLPGALRGGLAWRSDGVMVFGTSGGGLFSISANGGTATPLTRLDPARGETSHGFPAFLPDGRRLLYWARPSNTVWLTSLDGAEPKLILSAPVSQAVYAPPGWLLFVRQGTLLAQPFDPERATLTGEARPLAQQIIPDPYTGSSAFGASSNGVLAYRTGSISVSTQLFWVDRAGRRLAPIGSPAHYRNPALSPDGTRVAVEAVDPQAGAQDIWLIEFARGITTRFTFDSADDIYPVWSPDGHQIMFGSDRRARNVFSIYRKRADGVGTEEQVLESSADMSPLSWSPDGSFLVYRTRQPFTNLGILPLLGERMPYRFESVRFTQGQGQISPDGRWLAYNSGESGRLEVSVQSFPKPGGGMWQISKDGGSFPRWRRDGRELFYYASDGRLMGVPIGGTTGLEVGIPAPLFEPRLVNGPANTTGYRPQYDVSPDGQRFLVNVPLDEATASPITVVLNWPTLLKK